ncbi:MAG: hypothetical protein AB7G39_07395 [Alphaproteobacteria bacterium]
MALNRSAILRAANAPARPLLAPAAANTDAFLIVNPSGVFPPPTALNDEAAAYFELCLDRPVDEIGFYGIVPRQVVELLWPLNDLMYDQGAGVLPLRYHSLFEPEANEAILAYIEYPDPRTWSRLSRGCWRVLLERYLQLMTVALARVLVDIPIASLPNGLDDDQRRLGLMLQLMLRMTLPLPIVDRLPFEWLPGTTHPPKRAP